MSDPRKTLGRVVRRVWVAWALEQPDPKDSWLMTWSELDGGQREVDMRIGEAVAAAACRDAQGELADLQRRIDDLRAFERDYRARMHAYLEGLLDDIAKGGVIDG